MIEELTIGKACRPIGTVGRKTGQIGAIDMADNECPVLYGECRFHVPVAEAG